MDIRKLTSWRTLAVGFALMALAVACGGSDTTNTVDNAQAAPAAQQVLRVRIVGEPKTIDPHLSNFSGETTLMKSLWSGLFTYDESLKVVPNLAAELPTDDNGGVSKDGLTYTVKLNKDAKWSDGKALNANDFVYSMRRALDPKVAGPYASFFYGLAGAKDYNTALGTAQAPKTPTDSELSALRDKIGVEAKDASTLIYHLTDPNPSFLNLLSLWTAFPVRQDVIEKYGDKWTEAGNMIGNGPFVLKSWDHGQRLVFEPNLNWHREQPKLRQIVVQMIADDNAAYAAYLAGEIDSVVVPPANRREVASPGSPLNKELIRQPELVTFALFLNNSVAPFDNPKVRQAFGTAVNRAAYVDGVLQGVGKPTTSWLPPGMPGYNAEIGKQYEFNPTKARQLLAEAGFPEGKGLPKVTFIATNNDTNRLVGQFIEDQLKTNLGIEVENEYLESAVRGRRFTTRDYQATVQSWSADWAYPDNWLPELFRSTGGNNNIRYNNPRFDELITKAAAEVDEKKRLAIYDEAHKLMIDDAAVLPLYNREVFILVKPNVKNLVITGLDGAIKGDYNFHRTYIAAK